MRHAPNDDRRCSILPTQSIWDIGPSNDRGSAIAFACRRKCSRCSRTTRAMRAGSWSGGGGKGDAKLGSGSFSVEESDSALKLGLG